jgi:transposase-like protein
VRAGFFTRRSKPHRIQRYRCEHCGRYFSEQTFRTSYWLRSPELLAETFHALTHCTGFRQLARKHGCSPQTVLRHALRLGRHCLLFHEQLRPQGELTEPLALDGFRTFEGSQYHPSEFHHVVGQRSHYAHGFTHSELRRSGTMTTRQRARRALLERRFGRPDPKSVEREVARIVGIVTAGAKAAEIHTDENPAYPRALARFRGLAIAHHTVSSRAARTSRNPLFALNLLDLLIRHSCANQKRETIAFSKSVISAIARKWVFLTWRNYCKWFSERRKDGTPAMRAGVCTQRWSVRQLLKEQAVPGAGAAPGSVGGALLGARPRRGASPTRSATRSATPPEQASCLRSGHSLGPRHLQSSEHNSSYGAATACGR